MVYPNFFVVGANKSGTSSLAVYLDQHPQVFMCQVKEPRFFALEGSAPERRNRVEKAGTGTATLESYLRLFDRARDEIAIGEASTNYLSEPLVPLAIKRHVPGARIVAILRHPAERAFSNYSVFVHRGVERLPFDEAIRAELDHLPTRGQWHRRYVRLGFYGTQLARYLTAFDASQVRVFLYDDFQRDPAGLMRELYRFLGVDESFVPDMTRRHNVTVVPPHARLHKLVNGSSIVSPLLRRVVPGQVRVKMSPFPQQGSIRPLEFSPETRKLLIDLYRSDVLHLQDLIGRDLSAWMH